MSLTSEHEGEVSNGFRLWRSEWNRTLYGLYNALGDAFWLNHVRMATLADNSSISCVWRRNAAFRFPFTTSNSREDLMAFAREVGDVALKFMAQDMYRSDTGQALGLYVNRLTERELADFGGLDENPVTLQQYVDKDYEVRYTFVDGAHLACKILSQAGEQTKVDWRRYDIPNTPHLAMEPPDDVRLQVTSLMRALGLSFGAMDFIVDKSGRWWFLEVNSSGQWLWIEDLVGLRISDSITNCLVSRSSNGSKGQFQ